MQIITNLSKSRSHLTAINSILEGANDIVICSGWMRMCGLNAILPAIDIALAKGAQISVYTNAKHTDAGCVEALRGRPSLTHFNMVKPYLHTKLYYGRMGESFVAMVGSANITSGGLWKNEELSQLVSAVVSDPIHAHYMNYIEKLTRLTA